MENYCNNCNNKGHTCHNCKIPITSHGVICFRKQHNVIEYLMICRKDTLGYIDFMRGKYSIYNKLYIMNMFKQMTDEEKNNLKTGDFDNLWKNIWCQQTISYQYKTEENTSREKFNALVNGILIKNDFYNLIQLIDESIRYDKWTEAEWGFPKGRRNYQEKDYECAIREFTEETGLSNTKLHNIQNIIPYEEHFIGSNYKSYKHKYYLMHIEYEDSIQLTKFEKTEVSKMEWKTYDNCIKSIRYYNTEKIQLITDIHNTLNKTTQLFIV